MLQNLKKKQEGFTIIEVMIVLVIAAVILLIVFLAVPALQRNSRNTQLKNDVAAVLAAATEFQSNNNGAMPTSITGSAGTATVTGATGTNQTTARINGGTTVAGSTSVNAPAAGTTATINVRIGNVCNGNALGAASTRSYAALYNIEGAGGTTAQCQES